MNLNNLITDAFELAKKKGWHDNNSPSIGEAIALIHSEVSEALQEYRTHGDVNKIYLGKENKPEGLPIELADIVIRVADFCGQHKIDLMSAIKMKHEYNKGRQHRHGGKYL